MYLPNKINQLAFHEVSSADKLDLRVKLDDLVKLERVIHSTKRHYRIAHKITKLAARPKTVAAKPLINGVRFCRLCKRQLPHLTKSENQFHMLAAKRRWMQQAAARYWHARGYHELWQRSVRARYLRAINRRTAIFKQIAPKSAAMMTASQIEEIINRCRPGKTRWLCSIERWKAWVRKRYA